MLLCTEPGPPSPGSAMEWLAGNEALQGKAQAEGLSRSHRGSCHPPPRFNLVCRQQGLVREKQHSFPQQATSHAP